MRGSGVTHLDGVMLFQQHELCNRNCAVHAPCITTCSSNECIVQHVPHTALRLCGCMTCTSILHDVRCALLVSCTDYDVCCWWRHLGHACWMVFQLKGALWHHPIAVKSSEQKSCVIIQDDSCTSVGFTHQLSHD
jgi:hypothetical protein